MKTTILVICVFSIAFTRSEEYGKRSIGVFRQDSHPGKCVLLDGTILDAGQNRTIHCELINCRNEYGVVLSTRCETVTVPENCTLGDFFNHEADFPECCNRVLHCADGDREVLERKNTSKQN